MLTHFLALKKIRCGEIETKSHELTIKILHDLFSQFKQKFETSLFPLHIFLDLPCKCSVRQNTRRFLTEIGL